MSEIETKVTTPEFRLAFSALGKPNERRNDDGSVREVFEATLLFAPGTDLSALERAAKHAVAEHFGERARELWGNPKFLKPFKDHTQLVRAKDGEPYQGVEVGTVGVKANTSTRPGIVGPRRDPRTGKAEVLDADQIKDGDYCRATLVAKGYTYTDKKKNTIMNQGVKFYLQNIQLLRSGEAFGGRAGPAEDDFEPVEEPAEETNSLNAFLGGSSSHATPGSAQYDDDIPF